MKEYNFSGISSARNPSAAAPIYTKKEKKDAGGLLGGLGYLSEKLATGFVQSLEGIVDYTAGGLAKLFGADEWAEGVFQNDWFGDWYTHPDEWYKPSDGWKLAGDVAGGIGTSLPSLAAGAAAAAITVYSGGSASPLAAGLVSAATAGLGAAGTGTKEAMQKTGKLGGSELLYGALSGATEGVTEGLTNALTLGGGAILKNISKSLGKQVTASVAKQSALKTLGGAFLGEAFEEGFSEWVNPYIARATYDADAESATAGEVAYAALVGGLSGMVMGGGTMAIDSGTSFTRGTRLTRDGAENEVMALSRTLAAFQEENATENEAFRAVAENYKTLSESLATTGGKVTTAAQKKLLGDLSRANVAAVFSPMITRSAANIYANAEVIAERLNAYGYKDASGKPMNFTAEQIRAGIDPTNKKSFETALKTNTVLRTLAAADAAGQLTMDTRAFRDATLAGKNLARSADLWAFAESATADEVRAVSDALNIENWETLTEDEFAEKITDFLRRGGAEQAARRRETEARIFADTGTAAPMPRVISLADGESRKYASTDGEFAIGREGEEYRIYDFATKTSTKAMSRADVNKALADDREKRASILSEARENERRQAEIKQKREETDKFARENVKSYAELAAPAKTMVRKVISAARVSGLTDADAAMYATVSAHAGLDITFSKKLCRVDGGYADGFYDPAKNRIVVNPEGTRSAESLLLHELDHAVRSGIRKDGGTKMFAEAVFGIGDEAAQKITARYKNVESDVSKTELIWDEANAYFAETFFANKGVLESLTAKVPTIKERILAFLEGAKTDYAGAPKLEGTAKRYYKEYKKMFDKFAERNRGRNAEEAEKRYALPEGYKPTKADKEYMSALERGDMDAAQAMVETAANSAGYTIKAYHGTNNQFTVFDLLKSGDNFGETSEGMFFFTSIKEKYPNSARDYADFSAKKSGGKSRVIDVYLKMKNPLNIDSMNAYDPISYFDEHSEEIYDKYLFGDNDGIIIKDNTRASSSSVLYLLDDANRIKSADTVTYDDDGNVIPLSKRFTQDSPDIRYALPLEDSDGNELSEEQREYFAESKVLRGGKLLPLYHQTSADFTVFDTAREGAGARDNETPHGIFLKPTAENIGLKGNKQMKLYANITNPLVLMNRSSAAYYWKKNIDGYADIISQISENDRKYKALYEEADDVEKLAKRKNLDFSKLSRKEKGALYAESTEEIEKIIEEWGKANTVLDKKAKALIDKYLKDNGFDGMFLKEDIGSFGRKVETYIALSPEQVKNADNANPTSDPDIRYALPMDDEALDELLDEMSEQGVRFDPEGIIARGAPIVPESERAKKHTRARAFTVLEGLADNDLISAESRKEFTDVIYKAMNGLETITEKQNFAHEAAEFYVARLLTEVKTDNPDARPARERISWLNIGVGKLSFSPADMAEMRARLDNAEFKEVFGRWGKKTKGTPDYMLDMFTNEISATIPGMAYIGEKHPVDALLELDKMYREARKTITDDKYVSAYRDSTDDDILVMVKNAEEAIINGMEAQDAAVMEAKLEDTMALAEGYKDDYDQLRGTIRYRGYIAARVQKLGEMKKGIFHNSSIYKDDTFDKILAKLTSIEWRKTFAVKSAKNVLNELATWYAPTNALFGYVDEENPGYYESDLAEQITKLAAGENAFTADDLKTLDEVLGRITKFIEHYNKVYINGKWVDAEPMAREFVTKLHEGGKMKTGFFRDIKRGYFETFGDAASVVRYYDRYRTGGFFGEMFDQLRRAAISADTEQMRLMRDYEAFMKKHPKYLEAAERATIDFAGAKLPKMTAISLYMTMKREQARAGLAASGFAFVDENGERVRTEGFATSTELTPEAILSVVTKRQNELEKLLSAEDREYIKILEKVYNEEARRLKADRDMDRYGFTNVMNDYYYPIRRANTAKSVDTSFSAELDRVSNASFNKDIVKGAKGELFIQNADTLFRNHVRAVCQYYALSPAIEAYNKLYNMDVSGNPNKPISVKTESPKIWKKGDDYFRNLIGDIQGIPRERGEGMELLGAIRGGYAKFQLGANPKTWASQLSSIFAATSILDADSIAKASTISGKEVDKYCAIAELRNADNTAAMAQGVLTAGKRIKHRIDKVSDTLMKPIGMVDRAVVRKLFAACRAQVAKNGGPKIDTEQNRVEAGKLLERVILETQQNSFATERSAAMRSGNEILRTLTMFSADGMKMFGRVIDGFGEVSALRAQMKDAKGDARKALRAQMKAARNKLARSTAALACSSIHMIIISAFFRFAYNKDEDDEKSLILSLLGEFGSGMIGGLPLIRDFYTRIVDGFDVENATISAMNDMFNSAAETMSLSGKIMQGNATGQDGAKAAKNLAYAVGQFTGIPARNLYNVIYGITKRFSPETAYKVDEWFYEKNHQNDLYKALEDGDDAMAQMLLSLAVNENTSGALTDEAHAELYRLSAAGYRVLPRTVGKTVSIDGEEYAMAEEERDMVAEEYADVTDKLDALFKSKAYANMSDEKKTDAIKHVYNTAYDAAISDVYGTESKKSTLIAEAVGYDIAALYAALISGMGNKRESAVALIGTLPTSTEKKLLLICSRGYTLRDGDIKGLRAEAAKKRLLAYIVNMPGKTRAEKERLATICGFTVKNGKILLKNTA